MKVETQINCLTCKHYKFESGPADYCPSSYGVMYCELLHGEFSCFTKEEHAEVQIKGSPDNCPLKQKEKT